jgi:hypothetical protein
MNNPALCILGDPNGIHSLRSIQKGYKAENISVWENDSTHVYAIKQINDKINILEDYQSIDMNFYLTMGNPPFKGQLHLEFLLKALETSKNVNIIHPSGWLTRSEKQIEKDVRKALKNRVHKLTIFNGTPVFAGAQFQAPLVITKAKEEHFGPIEVEYKTTGNTYYIDSLNDFPTGYWEPTDVNYELRDLITAEAAKSNLLSLRTSNINSVPLNLPTICGHATINSEKKLFCDDFYTFFYRNSNIYNSDNNEGKFYSLNSEEERDNLVSYLKTKYARFALALNKATNRNNVSRYIENVPLPPLDQKWTEEEIMEYYGLNQQQKDAINEFIPTYYK